MYSIRETFVFQTEIYTFRIFIPSLCCFFFLSSQWGSVCCCCFSFFFLTRSTRTCRCHSKWSFFGSSVFLVVKNPYDLTSQIRFCILPKKRTLRLLTGGLSWGTQSVFARGVLSSPLSCRHIGKREDLRTSKGWTFYVDIHRNIAKGMMAVSVWFRVKLVSSKISFLLAR